MALLIVLGLVLLLILGLTLRSGRARPPMTPDQIADWERQKAEAALGNPGAGGRDYRD